MFTDKIAIASPASTVNTPIIIGFLTYLYIPPVINFFVGLHGARVPFPVLTKVDIVIIITERPMHIKIKPITDTTEISTLIFFTI